MPRKAVLLFSSLIFFIALFFLPILVGIVITLLTSVGFNFDQGIKNINLNAWQDFFQQSQTWSALYLTFKTSFTATILSVLITFIIGGCFYDSKLCNKLEKNVLPFLLSIPHSTFAIGLVFLIAPSGLIFRLLTPLFNWDSPPQITSYQDPEGYALILSLCIREIPFLLFLMISSLSQIKTKPLTLISYSMGYAHFMTWIKIIWPQIYQRLKLPIFVILAYSLTPIDMSIIIGPNNPPTLIVLILEWFREADLYFKEIASCGTVVILLIMLSQLVLWKWLEKVITWQFSLIKTDGRRKSFEMMMKFLGNTLMMVVFISMFLSFFLNLVWSFSKRWPFPEIFPHNLTWRYWLKVLMDDSSNYIFNSLIIGFFSTLFSIFLALLFLESEKKNPWLKNIFTFSLYFPLLIPNIIFLFGIYLFYLYVNFDFIFLKIILVHLLFIVPYIFIALRDNYHRYDYRYSLVGKSLGKSSFLVFIRIKLFILLKPLLFAVAIGFSVSFAEYLSTLWIGEGRVSTITTEAVTLSSGGSRNIIGVFAFLQILIPLAFFTLCIFLNKIYGYKK